MASKFYKNPQLSQTQMQQAAETTLSGVDNAANTKAAQAARSIDMLTSITKNAASTVAGAYMDNIQAKNRLESGREMPFYNQKVKQELANIENLEDLSRDGLNAKIDEITESFMERYKGKPYSNQLREDIGSTRGKVLADMIGKRDALHVQKVGDATSEKSSSLGQQFSNGMVDADNLKLSIQQLLSDSTVAHQVPTSSELDLSEESREKYQGLTKKQARDAVLKGLMVQTGQPNNSRVANLLADKDFRKMMEIGDTDEEYNKLVAHAQKKGAQADKFKYESDMSNLKEKLYSATNVGIQVDIDKQVQEYRNSGSQLTAQDEHKLRKEFKMENTLVATSADYISNLNEGKDISARMAPKQQQEVYNRAFTDVLGITESGASIGNISGSLSVPQNQQAFKDYVQSGGKVPKDVVGLFDVPAGASVDKWNEANAAIMSMEAAAAGSGYSVEEIIGVKQVSKIRGLSRLLNDDQMDEATKKNAIEAFHTQSTSFNSKGYLQGTQETRVDSEWLTNVSQDAPWTTDDYVSDLQNADEIAGNYQAYRLAGHDESTAQKMAVELFEQSNTNFEMPNGGEIIIPREHKYLNNEAIIAFSKDISRFPSLKEQRDDIQRLTGDNWLSDWRANRNISIQKSYNFGKTGKYDMLFDGKLVKDSSFTYEEIEEFISNTDYKTREKITGVKANRPFKEVEAEALENRKRKIQKKKSRDEYIDYVFDLTI